MNEKVSKIKVSMSQKINLGNYETRDYAIGIEIEGFDEKANEEIQKALDFGRELCAKEVGEYYHKVKSGLLVAEKLDASVDKQYIDLEKRIKESENEEQLRTLEDKIKEIEDKTMQKTMSKQFNLRLLSLKK